MRQTKRKLKSLREDLSKEESLTAEQRASVLEVFQSHAKTVMEQRERTVEAERAFLTRRQRLSKQDVEDMIEGLSEVEDLPDEEAMESIQGILVDEARHAEVEALYALGQSRMTFDLKFESTRLKQFQENEDRNVNESGSVETKSGDDNNGISRQLTGDSGNGHDQAWGVSEWWSDSDIDEAAILSSAEDLMWSQYSLLEKATPTGYYTWSESLAVIHRQDIFLRAPVKKEAAEVARRALRLDKAVSLAYAFYIDLLRQIFNPFVYWSQPWSETFKEASAKHSFRPITMAFEDKVDEAVALCPKDNPSVDDIEHLTRLVATDRLKLTPGPYSGWMDRVQFALEPMINDDDPTSVEKSKVLRGPQFLKTSSRAFAAFYSGKREQHRSKMLPGADRMYADQQVRPDILRPSITVEPQPTAYLRRALSYSYVRTLLLRLFNTSELSDLKRAVPTPTILDRVINMRSEASRPPILIEIRDMETLFHGAYFTVCKELGITPVDFGAVLAATSEWSNPPAHGRGGNRSSQSLGRAPSLGDTDVSGENEEGEESKGDRSEPSGDEEDEAVIEPWKDPEQCERQLRQWILRIANVSDINPVPFVIALLFISLLCVFLLPSHLMSCPLPSSFMSSFASPLPLYS